MSALPISREEFNAGRFDLTVPILDFLSLRREDAFTAEEVLEQMLVFGRAATFAEVVHTLNQLLDHELVESKEFSGSRWYTISDT